MPKKICLLNFVRNKIATHDGKVEFNLVNYTTAFLYISDWLYFLWHGINSDMILDQIRLIISQHFTFSFRNLLAICLTVVFETVRHLSVNCFLKSRGHYKMVTSQRTVLFENSYTDMLTSILIYWKALDN